MKNKITDKINLQKTDIVSLKKPLWQMFWVLLSGLALGFSFPLANIFPLAWVSLVPLFLIFRSDNVSHPRMLVILGGLTFHLFVCFWMKTFHPLSLILVIPYLTIYFILPFVLTKTIFKKLSPKFIGLRPLVFSLIWVGLEYIRSVGFLGFPWGVLGYSQFKFLPIIQIADIGGVFLVSFLIVYFNTSLAEVVGLYFNKVKDRSIYLKKMAPVSVLIFLSLIYGFVKLSIDEPAPTYKVAVLQAFVDPSKDWRTASRSMRTMAKIEKMSTEATNFQPDLIIWPETLMGKAAMYYHKYYSKMKTDSYYKTIGNWFYNLPAKLNSNMLLTAPERAIVTITNENGRKYQSLASFNSAYYVTADGKFQDKYQKMHLVPFGEWFPYKKTFPIIAKILRSTIASNFTPGKRFVIFKTKSGYFAVLICFEDIFGDLTRLFVKKGATFLINTTNDYWSRSIKSQEQHFAMSIFRAVENRCYLIRAANTGVTAVIDTYGSIKKRLPNYVIDVLYDKIPMIKRDKLTIYTRYGDWFGYFAFLIFLTALGLQIVVVVISLRQKVVKLVKRFKKK